MCIWTEDTMSFLHSICTNHLTPKHPACATLQQARHTTFCVAEAQGIKLGGSAAPALPSLWLATKEILKRISVTCTEEPCFPSRAHLGDAALPAVRTLNEAPGTGECVVAVLVLVSEAGRLPCVCPMAPGYGLPPLS